MRMIRAVTLYLPLGQRRLLMRRSDADADLRSLRSVRAFNPEVRCFLLDVWRDAERFDKCRMSRLDKHRLPNAARGRVPAPLFSDRLLRVLHRIFHAQNN